MGDLVIAVVVLVVVAWLVSRYGRPGGDRPRPTPDTLVGGSATWSAGRTPTPLARDGAAGRVPRVGGAPTPVPADPIVDRIGDEQFVEGFVIGRHVTLAEQDRLRAQERAFDGADGTDGLGTFDGSDGLGGSDGLDGFDDDW